MRRRGFTLIEAIVAIVILGVATPPMLVAQAGAHRDRVLPAMASQARWLAMEKLEDILADRSSPTRGWDVSTPQTTPTSPPPPACRATPAR